MMASITNYPSPSQIVESKDTQEVIVVIVPFLAQSHINLLFHMSRLLASYDLPVYFLGFSIDIVTAKQRIQGWNPTDYPTLRFHEFPSPPSYQSNTNPTREFGSFTDLLANTMKAAVDLRGPIRELLWELSGKCRRLVVVGDALMATAIQDVASILNAEAYNFYVGSAFHDASLVWEVSRRVLHIPPFLWKLIGKLVLPPGAVIPDGLPTPQSCFPANFLKFIVDQRANHKFFKGHLFDACRAIEGLYLDLLRRCYRLLRRGNVWGIGPLNPVVTQSETSNNNSTNRHRSLGWLDMQPPKSVIFVSFGTLTVLSDDQFHELAAGLEQSGQRFIWAVKDVLKGVKGWIGLPEGYEERVKGRGLILRDWVPQLEILEHGSTGGFLTHCGWNSCMESICRGVPMATWPIQYDQARNAVLMTEVLKIGIAVKDWERREEVITAAAIEAAVRRLIGSAEGEELRVKAREMGRAVKQSVMEGGVSRVEMDSFIAHIARKC
ncbi:hypothetical protein DM860_006155 [Cuscuta australis]|uniref:Glycosyltransferase n=1 Tax=Cuscuta australis TaxID=267555 RepID=A0A328DP67_9ASTE|nr:hypothetical protein DM860_006155 [Cuscuta australis]